MKSFFLKLSSGIYPEGFSVLKELKEDTAVVVGNFDGFHLGHRYLTSILRERAKRRKLKTLLVTFYPHPLRVLAKELSLCELTTPQEKRELLEGEGIDFLCFIRFDETFAKMNAREFLTDIIHKRLKCRYLLVGYDWRFGYKREGEIELAKEVATKLGFEVEEAEPYRKNGHIISSTLIRRLLSEGRLSEVREFLGRNYWIKRKVVKGKGRGSVLGVPTANLENTENLCLKEGVYIVRVNDQYPALANFGYRPTFGDKRRLLEVHIPGIKENFKGKEMKVEFLRFLREEKKFHSAEELKSQIEKDLQSLL